MNPSYFIPILFVCSPLNARPAWVDSPPNAYSAAGVGADPIAASAEAGAALAQSFGMDVSTQIEVWMTSEGFSYKSEVRTKTDHTLYGAYTAARWFDKKRNEYYALVSLDRQKALSELRPRAEALAEILNEEHEESLPRALARLARLELYAQELRGINAQLRALGEKPELAPSPEALKEKSARLQDKFAVRIEGISPSLAAATGMKISPKSPFVLRALRYSASAQDTGLGLWVCSLSLTLSLEEEGGTLAAVAYLEKGAGEDKKTAEECALFAMEQQLSENFKNDIYAALSGKE